MDKDAERDPWTKYRWWIIGGLGLAMAAAAGFMMKAPGAPGTRGAAAAASRSSSSAYSRAVSQPAYQTAGDGGGALQVLRDEMFAIETDRLEGRLSPSEYSELKSAFDIVLRRALARSGSQQVVTE